MNASQQNNQKIKVAAMKIASRFGSQAATNHNVQVIKEAIDRAAKEGVKIIVMPETAINGYASQDLNTIWQAKNYPINSELFKGLNPTEYAFEIRSSQNLP